MRALVLGAGLQGTASAFDLLQNPDVSEVRLAGLLPDELPVFLRTFGEPRLQTVNLDVGDHRAVAALMRGVDSVCCALPYYYNLDMTRLAIEAGAHFCDLGGNTEIVFQQKELDDAARASGVSVVPDCGVAPGMVNVLAQHGISQMDRVESVKIFVGGLPQQPEPPLNYQIVYSLEGVLDYYTTLSWVLRGGRREQVKALTELELVRFPEPVGELEAFHTAGGLSTMAFRYEGRIPTMEYKTLRYPGHAAIVRAMRDLGLFDLEPVRVKGVDVVPRDVAIAVMGPRLTKPARPDLVALRVQVAGERGGKPALVSWDLVDRFDAVHGVSAMMRTTGYSLAITGWMQATKQVAGTGVLTPDEAMPADAYVAALRKRGIDLKGRWEMGEGRGEY